MARPRIEVQVGAAKNWLAKTDSTMLKRSGRQHFPLTGLSDRFHKVVVTLLSPSKMTTFHSAQARRVLYGVEVTRGQTMSKQPMLKGPKSVLRHL